MLGLLDQKFKVTMLKVLTNKVDRLQEKMENVS